MCVKLPTFFKYLAASYLIHYVSAVAMGIRQFRYCNINYNVVDVWESNVKAL